MLFNRVYFQKYSTTSSCCKTPQNQTQTPKKHTSIPRVGLHVARRCNVRTSKLHFRPARKKLACYLSFGWPFGSFLLVVRNGRVLAGTHLDVDVWHTEHVLDLHIIPTGPSNAVQAEGCQPPLSHRLWAFAHSTKTWGV